MNTAVIRDNDGQCYSCGYNVSLKVLRNILFISSTPINTKYNRLDRKSKGEVVRSQEGTDGEYKDSAAQSRPRC
jgi:hypothetical protein